MWALTCLCGCVCIDEGGLGSALAVMGYVPAPANAAVASISVSTCVDTVTRVMRR